MTKSDQDWKEKYLSSLDQQEKLEQQSEQTRQKYQSLSNKLIVAAQGQSLSMDSVLKQIRKQLNNAAPASSLIAELEQQILALDENKELQQEHLKVALSQLCEHLQRFQGADEINHELKKLRNKSSVDAEDFKQLAELLKQASGGDEGGKKEKGSLLSRLFNKKPDEAERPEESRREEPQGSAQQVKPQQREEGHQAEISSPGDDVEHRGALLQTAEYQRQEFTSPSPQATTLETKTAAESHGDNQLLSKIVSILKRLLENLPLGDNWHAQLNGVLKQLRDGVGWSQLPQILQKISQLVIAANEQEQNQFEAFLHLLEQQLLGLTEKAAVLKIQQKQVFDATDDFHQGLSADVSGMGQVVHQATDLEAVKVNVAGLVSQVQQNLSAFQQSQQQREADLQMQVHMLSQRLIEVEDEAKQARQNLQQEREQLLTDSLTELPNRAAYDRRIEEELERWNRYHRPAVLAVTDIDFFKRVNDTHGHLAGDKVLKVVAAIIRKRLRNTDFIARYGGEEFAIIMAETELEDALKVMDHVRKSVAETQFKFQEVEFTVSISCGLAAFGEDETAEHLFQQADDALYKAKDGGRNQCQLAQ